MTKSQNMPVWLSIIAQFAVPAKSCNNNIEYRPEKKSVINMI
jgi:hypothetical protein